MTEYFEKIPFVSSLINLKGITTLIFFQGIKLSQDSVSRRSTIASPFCRSV